MQGKESSYEGTTTTTKKWNRSNAQVEFKKEMRIENKQLRFYRNTQDVFVEENEIKQSSSHV